MNIKATSMILPIDYKPSDNDILSGRGRTLNAHKGNMHFIDIIKSNLQQYIDAPRRMHKSFVIDELVASVFSSGFRFIKKNTKTEQWYVMNRNESYTRVGHALRDLKYKKSNKTHSKLAIKKESKEESGTLQQSFVGNDSISEKPRRVSVSGSSVSCCDEASTTILGDHGRSSLCRSCLDLTQEESISIKKFKF